MPPLPGYWHSLLARHGRVWKAAYKELSRALETKLSARTAQAELVPVRVTVRSSHPAARLRGNQSGWSTAGRHFDAAVRYFSTETNAVRGRAGKGRASYQSVTWKTINQSSGRAPFASTLRPNLTGGTLGRTAGGYSLGGGRAGAQRYFSHGPAAQTQVVQNVSHALRAFMLGGQKAQFNGVDPVTGNKRFKAVTKLQHESGRKMAGVSRTTPGSYVAFGINPTVTALTPLKNVTGFEEVEGQHLNSEGLLDVLSADFSRSLKELAAVLADLRRLSGLGDMPITYHQASLRVHFPGCDADTVERLCNELNVKRGVVVQDEDFDTFVGTEMALLFPFAPSKPGSTVEQMFDEAPVQRGRKAEKIDWREMLSSEGTSELYSTRSDGGLEVLEDGNPWVEEVLDEGSLTPSSDEAYSSQHSPLEYQGVEGIYRFIEQCDRVQRR